MLKEPQKVSLYESYTSKLFKRLLVFIDHLPPLTGESGQMETN